MRNASMKYRNKRVMIDGIRFDSKAEGDRYLALKAMQAVGAIQSLRMQVPFLLIPRQRRDDGVAERECRYLADFVYLVGDKTIVEDVKGVRTAEYIMKRKLMLSVFGVSVQEVGVKKNSARIKR